MNAISDFRLNASALAASSAVEEPLAQHDILSIVDEAISRLIDAQSLAVAIDQACYSTVVVRAEQSADKAFMKQADQIISLISIAARELAATHDLLSANYSNFLAAAGRGRDTSRTSDQSAWKAILDGYLAAEAVDITDMDDDAAEKAADAESDSLQLLVRTRPPTTAALLEKLKILKRTDTFINEGFVEELLLDAQALS